MFNFNSNANTTGKTKTAKKFDTGRKSSRHQAAKRAESRRGYRQFGQIRHSQQGS